MELLKNNVTKVFMRCIGYYMPTGSVLIIGKVTQVIMHAYLARQLGNYGYGAISIAIASGQIAAWTLSFGLPVSSTKFVAKYLGEKNEKYIYGYLIFSSAIIIAVLLIGYIIWSILTISYIRDYGETSILSFLFFVFFLIASVRGAIMRGLGYTSLPLVPWELITPSVMLLIITFYHTSDYYRLGLIFFYVSIINEIIWVIILVTKLPKKGGSVRPAFNIRLWISSLWTFFGYQIGRIVLERLDVVLVGFLLSVEWAGLYAVGLRLAQAINLLGRIVISVSAPALATAFHCQNWKDFKRSLVTGMFFACLSGILGYLALAIFAAPLISWFGISEHATTAIIVLLAIAGGELVVLLTAPAQQALLMSRHERPAMIGHLTGAILLVAGMPIAAHYGVVGAALWRSLIYLTVSVGLGWVAWHQFKTVLLPAQKIPPGHHK